MENEKGIKREEGGSLSYLGSGRKIVYSHISIKINTHTHHTAGAGSILRADCYIFWNFESWY